MNEKQTLIRDTSVPVVVLKLNHHGGLGTARSLGRLGVFVYGISSTSWAPGLYSRYCRGRFVWDVDGIRPDETAQYLLSVAKMIGGRSILIHNTDEMAMLLADYAPVLRRWYDFPYLSPHLVRALINKREMYLLAKKHDIPTAETDVPRSREDVEAYLEHANFPVMLKGIYSGSSQLRTGKRMFIAKTKRELLYLYDRYEDPSNPIFMLQEFIPGGEDSVWMFNGYFNERSECLFGITGRKIRQMPAYTGATSLGICVRNEAVEETTKFFMERIGYKGILDIGYRYDRRDGKYKVLDINPRIGTTFRLFTGADGLDVVRAEYLDLTGQEIPESHAVDGRKWFVEDSDLISSVRYFLDKRLSLRQYLASFRGIREAAWFAHDDPLPFFVMNVELAHKVPRLLRSVRPIVGRKN